MKEQWKPVVGFEGKYEVSNLGRVKSYRRGTPRILRPGIASHGYPTVALGRGNTRTIHSLVAEAFIGPCPEGHEVMHADDDRTNPRLNNLSYGTRQSNVNDMLAKGRHAKGYGLRGTANHKAKLTWADVAAIRRDIRTQRVIAKDYGVTQPTIGQIKRGRTWKIE